MREEQVANGVNFLVHPKVKTAPLSQRISFLENKGLTPQEIQAALSRVEAGEGDLSAAAGGDTGTTSSPAGIKTSPFPAEASVPLWRQVAVPGALVVGAVGALGTYYAASRSAAERGGPNHQAGESSHAGRIPPYSSGGVAAEPGGMVAMGEDATPAAAYAEGGYAQERLTHSQRLEAGGAAFHPVDGVNVADGPPGSSGGEASSVLAGEFRRLTETMEHQTGQLVEAVGAMKALASRAEQDSSSLLAARVSSHTSELRAELGTIKQLLLLQAGAGAGSPRAEGNALAAGGSGAAAIAAASVASNGAITANGMTSPKLAVGGAAERKGLGNGGVEGSVAEGVKAATEKQASGLDVNNGPSAKDLEQEKAKEAAAELAAKEAALAATARRKDVARAALTALLADNAPQAAKDGIAMLRMLVANLVNQPNVPRYRRIATSNDNFKKRLLPLEGHRAMMEAVGFKAKGSLWEWTWHEDSGPSASSSNKAVLEDVVNAIDAVARPNGPPLSSATPTTVPVAAAPTPAAASLAPPATSTSTSTSTSTAVSTNQRTAVGHGGAAVSEANGVARQRPRFSDTTPVGAAGGGGGGGGVVEGSGGGNVSGAIVDANAGLSRPSGRATTTNDVLAAAAEVNGAAGDSSAREAARLSGDVKAAASAGGSVVEAPTGEESAVIAAVAAGPSENSLGIDGVAVEPGAPPASMAEVAAAIQRGDEPPGIRVVEDRLSADAQSLVAPSQSSPSPPKPWEVFAGAAATGVVSAVSAENRGVGGERARGDGVGNGGRGYGSGSGEDGTRPQHAVSVGP